MKILSAVMAAGISVVSVNMHDCGSDNRVSLQSPSLIAPGASTVSIFDGYMEEEYEEETMAPLRLGKPSVTIDDYTVIASLSYSDIASEYGSNPADPLIYDGNTYWINVNTSLVASKSENEVSESEEDSEDNPVDLNVGDSVVRISYTNDWSFIKLTDGEQGYVRNAYLSSTAVTPTPVDSGSDSSSDSSSSSSSSSGSSSDSDSSSSSSSSSSSGSSTGSSSSSSSGSDSGSGSSSSSSSSSAEETYKETPCDIRVYANCYLNTRSGPGISYEKLSTLGVGDPIDVVAKTDNGWYKSVSGYYVKASLTIDYEPSPTPTPVPSSSSSDSGSSSSSSGSSGDSGFASYIKSFIGCSYVAGGASPSGFDCSGFVMYCYQSYYNISLPHGATSVSYKGYEVDRSDIQVGDIICFDRNGDGTMEHCALYVGNDTYVHAKGSQWGVVSDCFSSASGVAHIRRVL